MITTDIELCVDALTRGELIAFPTETVFGLGARSDSADAVSKVFEIKSRPHDHPLIVHCADIDVALAISPDVPESARALAHELWPGPMTLIFRRAHSDAICDEAVGGHDTVAIRVPSHPIARELLVACPFFVSAPSANKFGRVSPTTAQHVQSEFGDDVLILDGEQSRVGVESTIISCVNDHPRIVREGAVTAEDILRVTGHDQSKTPGSDLPAAPGNRESHYAPSIPLYVVDGESDIEESGIDAHQSAYLSFVQPTGTFAFSHVVSTYDEYAHELYGFFREAEKRGCVAIFVASVEAEGIGRAIRDRLSKAAYSYKQVRSGN